MGAQAAASNWPGGSYDPETHTLYVASQTSVATLGLVPPPPGVSDMAYHQGTVLSGPRTAGWLRRRRRHRTGCGESLRRSGRAAAHGAGTAAHQAAVQPHHRDRSRHRRLPLAGAVRRHAGQHPQSPGAQRAEPAAGHGPAGEQPGHARDEDARDCRREQLRSDAVRAARRDAARARQDDGQRGRRGLHAGAANRVADDLHAERPPVPRRRDQRRQLQRRARRLQASRQPPPSPLRHGIPATGGDIEITPLLHSSIQLEHAGKVDPGRSVERRRTCRARSRPT